MHKLMLPVAMVIALAACQPNTGTQTAANTDSLIVDSLHAEVMDIHDEGMAKMMAIRRLKTRSTEVKDSLAAKKQDTTAYANTIALLDSANDAMNSWMHSFDMKMEGKQIDEKKAYLTEEKNKISKVKELMEQSISEAKTLLKEQ